MFRKTKKRKKLRLVLGVIAVLGIISIATGEEDSTDVEKRDEASQEITQAVEKNEGNTTQEVVKDETEPDEMLENEGATEEEEAVTEEVEEETPTQVFQALDVSDATIRSIQTYGDYLVMYHAIIDDYLANYEEILRGTIFWSEVSFNETRKEILRGLEEQKAAYDTMVNMNIVGRETIIEFLINYRNSMNEMLENLRTTLNP